MAMQVHLRSNHLCSLQRENLDEDGVASVLVLEVVEPDNPQDAEPQGACGRSLALASRSLAHATEVISHPHKMA